MERDRDDDPRRLLDRGRGRGLLGSDRDDPPAGKFDPAEFDMPSDPPPSAAGRARGAADAAQAHSFFSHLDTNIQRVLAGFGTLRDLVSDVRASLADAAARDAQRAEEEEARDKAIAARLVDPAALEARAEAGARHGAADGLAGAAETLRRRIDADTAAHTALADRLAADVADRRAYEMGRRRRDGWWNGALAAFALLVPVALGCGYYLGDEAGDASGYARARDEVAAASWANTPNGKLARQLDQASTMTIPDIAGCPKGNGWHSEKREGVRYCFATNANAKSITGWPMP
uniref:hypothetical protein n=1 Tax=Sphingomonas sp. TaxID=28214 RepID=UPI001599CEE4|nr:hypothetical protein [Sphingomonas sp.]QJS06597.1 hypothetical protein [Sphingomonas sp.]